MIKNFQITSDVMQEPIIQMLQSAEESMLNEYNKSRITSLGQAEQIARILEGNHHTRLTSLGNNITSQLINRITPFVKRNETIKILTAVGGRKYKCNVLEQGLDIAELMSLSTLVNINQVIKKAYTPGVKFIIVNEDIGECILHGDKIDNITDGTRDYTNKVIALTNLFNLNSCGGLYCINESTILQKTGTTWQDFITESSQLSNIFFKYIQESDDTESTQKWESLNSFSKLQNIGWLGNIPRGMRDFYYDRISLSYGRDKELGQKNLAQLFSAILLRKKLGVTNYNPDSELLPLRMSFTSPTPGMPTRFGRLYPRAISKRISSSTIPYWTGNGHLMNKNGKLKPKISSRYIKPQSVIKNSIHIKGLDQKIEADILTH